MNPDADPDPRAIKGRPEEATAHGEPPLELDGIVRSMLNAAGLLPSTSSDVPAAPPASPAPPAGGVPGGSLATAGWLPPLEDLAPSSPTSIPTAPGGAEPAFYFLRDSHPRPGGGMAGPGHPLADAPAVSPLGSAHLPGAETGGPTGAALAEGHSPNPVSLDLVEGRPGGRDVPLAPPLANAVSPAAPMAGAAVGAPAPAGSPAVPLETPPSGVPSHPVIASAESSSASPGRRVGDSGLPKSENGNVDTIGLDAARDPALMSTAEALPGPAGGPGGGAPSTSGVDGFYFVKGPEAKVAPRSQESGRAPRVRDDFPILAQRVNGHRLIWLDSGATTQKPNAVIDGEAEFYRKDNSNVHRGAHTLAGRATDAYERARQTVQRFLGAQSSDEIVFVRGTTEAVNLVAQSYGRQNVRAGDEILVTHLEHHSNIVPWQLLCQQTGAILRVAPVDNSGELMMDAYERLLGPRTRIVAMTHVSNVVGTVLPVAPLVAMAHRHGARVLVDGAQAVAHVPVDVRSLDADFYVFSGHKIYGPTGVGALYGKKALLDAMPPWQGGGSMITDVTFERSSYAPVPAKFEAGTGNIAGAVALGLALDYLDRLGRLNVAVHEEALARYALDQLHGIKGLRMVGSPRVRVAALSFVIDGRDPLAIAQALDRKGIAVRAGHHCAQPILRRFGLEASVRASLGVYNAEDDIDALIEALRNLDPL